MTPTITDMRVDIAAPVGAHGVGEHPPRGDGHERVDPCRQRVPGPRALQRGQIAPASHHVDRCHPESRCVAERHRQRVIRLGGGRCRNGAPDRARRVVLEDPRRLPGRGVAHDLAAGRGARGARDAGEPEREGVRDAHVTVEAAHEDRVVRRDGVDPLPPREGRAGPALVVPVPTGDPSPFRQPPGELGDPTRELRRTVRVPQVHRHHLETAIHEVGVGVPEARQHAAAPAVEHARGGPAEPVHVPLRAHGDDRVAADGDPRGPWPRRVSGPHLSVHEEVGRPVRGLPARDKQARRSENETDTTHPSTLSFRTARLAPPRVLR